MIIDNRFIFSDAQTLAAAAGSYVSTNSYDNGVAPTAPGGFGTVRSDPFRGLEHMELLVQLLGTVTSGGAATLQFQLIEADDAALTTGIVVLAETAVLALATLVAGYRPRLRLPLMGLQKRYFGLRYVIGTATTTGGSVHASLVPAVDLGLAIDP